MKQVFRLFLRNVYSFCCVEGTKRLLYTNERVLNGERGTMKQTTLRLWIVLFPLVLVGTACNSFFPVMAKGGTEFRIRLETQEPDKKAVVEKAITVTQNKLNLIKLKGDVAKHPDDPTELVVRVYGAQNLERLRKFLFTSYQLELMEVVSPPNPSPVKVYRSIEDVKLVAKDSEEIISYFERSDSKEQFILVKRERIATGDDVRDAKAFSRTDSEDNYQISFSLKPQGAARFGDWTGKNINNYLAIVVDKKAQSVAYIKSQIFDSGEISGRFSKEHAEDIAMSLKSGYLPATMKIVSENQIKD